MSTVTPPTAVADLSATEGAMVSIRGLTKRFPVRQSWGAMVRHPFRREFTTALVDVSIDVPAGGFFGLLGPNGAGKTTLFKLLATLVLPDEGAATVDGHDVVRDAAAVRSVLAPVIADERSLYWRLSARRNLELYAALLGLRGATARDRVQQVLTIVELEFAGERQVGTYSSGMKRRLLIARALLSRPRVLLLDEPTASLDPISAQRFRRFLREGVGRSQGCTVLLATHQTEEALELCDQLGVLSAGRMLAVGSALALRRQFGGEQCRVVVPTCEAERCRGAIARLTGNEATVASADDPGWSQLEFDLPGGRERIADLSGALVAAGIRIGAVDRVALPLADLIGRIVRARGGDAR